MSEFLNAANPFFGSVILLSGIIYFFMALVLIRHWKVNAVPVFILLMLAAGIYALGYYFQLQSIRFEEFMIWMKIKYLGLAYISSLWLIFILQLTRRDQYINKKNIILLLLIPTITLILIFLSPTNKWFYEAFFPKKVNGYMILEVIPGLWSYIHYITSHIIFLAGTVLLAISGIQARGMMRLRYLWLLGGILLPWPLSVLLLLNLSPHNIDLAPFALVFTAFVVVIQLSQLKLFNVLPVARSRVFDVINKGIIVIDQDNNVADINPWAKTSLSIRNTIVGTSIFSLFAGRENFLKELFADEVQTMEVFWDRQPAAPKWLEIWQRPLINKKGILLGRLITLSDVTLRKENEEALSNERILLRTLIDNLPVSVYAKDTTGRKTLANKADLLYMGLEHESEAIGKTDYDLYPRELASKLYSNDQKVLQSGQPLLDQEELLPGKEEKERWVLTSKVPFLDNQGKMLGILGIGRDISDWKKMRKELENSEARFRTLTEATSAAVFIYQGERFIYLNPASEKLTGYSAEELKQMNFWDIVHPDYREQVKRRGLNRQMNLPESAQYEFKIITKAGLEKWIDYSTGIAMYQGEIAAIGTCFDITKRKTAEEALARSEQRYRKIFENSNTGILQLDPRGQVMNANNAFAQIFGYDNALKLLNEKTGIYQRIFSRQEDQLHFFREIELHDSVHNFSFEAYKINGNKVWVMVNAWKSQPGGKSDYLIEGFFQDITDRKLSLEYQNEVEVARKSSETKNQFLANMSHEIRTPVNGIMGMADILSHTELTDQQKEYLKTIEDSSQILLNIINDILDISKIEAGKMQLRPEVFSLRNMMVHLNKMFDPIASNNKLQLKFNIDQAIPEWLHGDKKRLEQILLNLISNALKFTNQGWVIVNLSSHALDSSRQLIRFEVKDSGMGIDPAGQAKLFQKFSQLDNSLTRGTGGTGLGLFICRELVKLMNGEIAVTSTPSKGSTFWFSIPLQTADAPEKTIEKSSTCTLKASPSLSVLVVDDKLVNQKVLSLMLQGEGCKVDVACNGQEAINKFDPEKHQMVFMDIMMPVMDGVTAMKTLHLNHDSLPPIIALTANAMEGDAQNYLNSGFNDYLAKPVSRKDLQLMLDKWILVSG